MVREGARPSGKTPVFAGTGSVSETMPGVDEMGIASQPLHVGIQEQSRLA
jgi:hypothetical protein